MEARGLSLDEIRRVVPWHELNDLVGNNFVPGRDIENDFDYVLEWLRPIWSWDDEVGDEVGEVSPRIRAALKSCLKEETSQVDFIKLYDNCVRRRILATSGNLVAETTPSGLSVEEMVERVKEIKDRDDRVVSQMGLGELAASLHRRNMDALFRSVLIEDGGKHFLVRLRSFLRDGMFCGEVSGEVPEEVCGEESGSDSGPAAKIYECIKVLLSVGLQSEFSSIIIELSIKQIRDWIRETCTGVWEKPLLSQISQWIKTDLYPKFSIAINLFENEGDQQDYLYDLIKLAHMELVSLRIDEIFDMVVNYPTSMFALSELHQCILFKLVSHNSLGINNSMQSNECTMMSISASFANTFNTKSTFLDTSSNSQSYQRAKLVDKFISKCHQNLLHSGANTVDIITSYISTIKSFLIIDPKGVLLDKVVRPIRRYLKYREDIIIKIVHGLLDDSKNNPLIELAHELRTGKKETYTSEENIDINWVPDPIDALPDFKKGKVTDIIESLISIFDLKEIFIDEFTSLFGKRLTSIHNYDIDDIKHHLHLLKARFGENDFNILDVMIRDVEESVVTNSKIFGDVKPVFHSTIVSHLYWQHIDDIAQTEAGFHVPDVISKEFNNFNQKYSDYKKRRRLKLVSGLGLVKLDIIINGVEKYFEVSPSLASVITLFNDRSLTVTLSEIVSRLGMSEYNASKNVEFWVKEGVLKEVEKSVFVSNE